VGAAGSASKWEVSDPDTGIFEHDQRAAEPVGLDGGEVVEQRLGGRAAAAGGEHEDHGGAWGLAELEQAAEVRVGETRIWCSVTGAVHPNMLSALLCAGLPDAQGRNHYPLQGR
jgi:hypothetical protein